MMKIEILRIEVSYFHCDYIDLFRANLMPFHVIEKQSRVELPPPIPYFKIMTRFNILHYIIIIKYVYATELLIYYFM